MSHPRRASPCSLLELNDLNMSPPRSKLFLLGTALSPSSGERWVWCRSTCARCARRRSALSAVRRRQERAEVNAYSDRSWVFQGLHPRRESGWRPEPVSMRVLLSVLYPVLSLTIFGLYPSMVSLLFRLSLLGSASEWGVDGLHDLWLLCFRTCRFLVQRKEAVVPNFTILIDVLICHQKSRITTLKLIIRIHRRRHTSGQV